VAAKTLFDRISVGDVDHGTRVRDIYRKQWSLLTTPEEVAAAVQKLEEHGWVRLATAKPDARGGRPSEVLHIHPNLRG
jgi:alkanesulfonate monooxygenase SsuD/methylene tetrahydromethanopterin reductase-like flavin-dependent oxidoreductase (luciferase family)